MKSFTLFVVVLLLASCISQKKNIQKSDDHHKIAIGLLKQCDKKRALSHLITAVTYDPKNFILRHSLATTYHVMGEYTKSLTEYKKSLKLQPKLTETRVSMAGVYIQLKKLNKAFTQIKKAEEDITYTNQFKLLSHKAWWNYEKGDYLKAKIDLEELLSIPRGKTCFHYLKLAQTDMMLGNLKESEKNFKHTLFECRKLSKNACVKRDYEEYFYFAKLKLKQNNNKKAKYYLKLFLQKVRKGDKVKQAQKILKDIS